MADTADQGLNADKAAVGTSLHEALDDLWTQYLSLLDQYQGLRQEFARNMASGHFDLAKANFSNPHQIRYGKDFYDERMQATSRVSYKPKHFFTLDDEPVVDEDLGGEQQLSSEGEGVETLVSLKDSVIEKSDAMETSKIEPKAKDPLFWFGVLAPAALRHSQSSFRDAVGKAVRLTAVGDEMRAIEIEIRRTRKKIEKAAR